MATVETLTRPPRLWRNRDFAAFWIGETISGFGTQVTFVALPLVAVLAPATIGPDAERQGEQQEGQVLGKAQDTDVAAMLASYTARGLLVALVPVLAFFHVLRLPMLHRHRHRHRRRRRAVRGSAGCRTCRASSSRTT